MAAKKKPGECCELMRLVLSRQKVDKREGIMREPTWNFKTGVQREIIVVWLPKKRGATYSHAILNYCPFCKASL